MADVLDSRQEYNQQVGCYEAADGGGGTVNDPASNGDGSGGDNTRTAQDAN